MDDRAKEIMKLRIEVIRYRKALKKIRVELGADRMQEIALDCNLGFDYAKSVQIASADAIASMALNGFDVSDD